MIPFFFFFTFAHILAYLEARTYIPKQSYRKDMVSTRESNICNLNPDKKFIQEGVHVSHVNLV